MRTGRVNVRSGLSSDSSSLTAFEQSVAVLSIGHRILALALNKDACMFVLANVQRLFTVTILKQIEKFLVVDLQERAVNCVVIRARFRVSCLHCLVVILFKLIENLLD